MLLTQLAPNLTTDLVVCGLGHSGTSLLTQMLIALGWKRNDAHNLFFESKRFRQLNVALIRESRRKRRQIESDTPSDMLAFLGTLERPFILKDPRFTLVFEAWITVFRNAGLSPALVLIERDPAAVEKSYRDRGELVDDAPRPQGLSIPEYIERLTFGYESWPFPKVAIRYEDLVSAGLLVQQQRNMRIQGGIWT